MLSLWIVSVVVATQSLELALDEGIRRYWNGEYEETILVLEPACDSNVSSGEKLECHKYLAFSHVALGEDSKAHREFGRLLSTDPGYRFDEMTVSPKILARFESARTELAKSIYQEGKRAYQSEDFSRAIELLDKTLELDPDNELAREYQELSEERIRWIEATATVEEPEQETEPVAEPDPEPVVDVSRIYHVTSDIDQPVLVERIPPVYPLMARQRRIEGTVVLSVVIGRDGSVPESSIIRSASPELDEAARDAVRAWRYQPATLSGVPVSVYSIVELSFQLNDD